MTNFIDLARDCNNRAKDWIIVMEHEPCINARWKFAKNQCLILLDYTEFYTKLFKKGSK